jgi:hypothetical protein
VLFALLSCLAASPVHADAAGDPPATTEREANLSDAQGRSHFRRGRQHYAAGEFLQAAREFEIAHGLSGRDALLYNVYLAYRDAQLTDRAAQALRGYLTAVPDAPDGEHLRSRLAALESQVAAEERAEAARAAEAEQRVAALEAAKRQRRAAEAERRRAEERSRRIAAQRPSRPVWPWFVVGGGVALVGGGVALGVLTRQDAETLRGDCVLDPRTEGADAPLRTGTACAPGVELGDRRSTIERNATIADALWIGGTVTLVTGAVLAFALPDVYPELPEVAVQCHARGCAGSVEVSF